jgi:hypothetical protein
MRQADRKRRLRRRTARTKVDLDYRLRMMRLSERRENRAIGNEAKRFRRLNPVA